MIVPTDPFSSKTLQCWPSTNFLIWGADSLFVGYAKPTQTLSSDNGAVLCPANPALHGLSLARQIQKWSPHPCGAVGINTDSDIYTGRVLFRQIFKKHWLSIIIVRVNAEKRGRAGDSLSPSPFLRHWGCRHIFLVSLLQAQLWPVMNQELGGEVTPWFDARLIRDASRYLQNPSGMLGYQCLFSGHVILFHSLLCCTNIW